MARKKKLLVLKLSGCKIQHEFVSFEIQTQVDITLGAKYIEKVRDKTDVVWLSFNLSIWVKLLFHNIHCIFNVVLVFSIILQALHTFISQNIIMWLDTHFIDENIGTFSSLSLTHAFIFSHLCVAFYPGHNPNKYSLLNQASFTNIFQNFSNASAYIHEFFFV